MDMQGRTIVMTGASSGLGAPAAIELAKAGADLILLVRDMRRGEAIQKKTRAEARGSRVELVTCDLASLASIASATEQVRRLTSAVDVLLNNAGIMKAAQELTADGFETTIAVNHLAVASLTLRLLPLILAAPAGRIVNVNSEGHRAGLRGEAAILDPALWRGDPDYGIFRAYSHSKLANLMFTYELARRIGASGPTVNALHPGVVRTDLGRELSPFLTKPFHLFSLPPRKGGESLVYLASSQVIAKTTGKYFDQTREVPSSPRSYAVSDWDLTWAETMKIIGMDYPTPPAVDVVQ